MGWRGYYGYCETSSVLRDLDSWIRRRLRSTVWKQWKVYRKRKRELIKLGISGKLAHATAWSVKGPWRSSHAPGVCIALNKDYFAALGLPGLAPCPNFNFTEPPWYGPVCRVVWEGKPVRASLSRLQRGTLAGGLCRWN